MSQFDSHDKSPREKALESRTKPAAVHMVNGKTVYAEFAEFRGDHVYCRPVRYQDDDQKVGDYIPAHRIDSMTRLNGGD